MTRSDLGQIVSACAVATSLILGACGPSNRPRQLVNTGGKAPDAKLTPEGGLVTTPVCEGAISATIKDYRTKLAAANSPSKALLEQIKSVSVNLGDDGQPSSITLNNDSKSSVPMAGGTVNGLKVAVQKTSAMKGADPKDSACENSYLIAISRGEGAQAGTVYATAVVLGATVKVSDLRCEGGTNKRSELENLAKSLSESKTGKNSMVLTTLVSAEGKKSQSFSVGGAGLKLGFTQAEVKADAKSEAKSVVDAESLIAQSGSVEIFGSTSGATQTKETIDFRMQLDLSKGVQGETKQLIANVSAARDGKSSATGIAFSGPDKCDAVKDDKDNKDKDNKDAKDNKDQKPQQPPKPDQASKPEQPAKPGQPATSKPDAQAPATKPDQSTPVTKPDQPAPPATKPGQPVVVKPDQPAPPAKPSVPVIVAPTPAPAPAPTSSVTNAQAKAIQAFANSMVAGNLMYLESGKAVDSASQKNVDAIRARDEKPSDAELIRKEGEAKKALDEAIAVRDGYLSTMRSNNSQLKAKVEACNKDTACSDDLKKILAVKDNSVQKSLDLKF